MANASITYWHRLEPRPRTNDIGATLAAEVRDPLWLLLRQWQLGEFSAEDAGSPAFIEYRSRSAGTLRWTGGGSSSEIDASTPLERQTLAEPIQPDLTIRVELGLKFLGLLTAALSDTTRGNLSAAYALTAPVEDEFDPLGLETRGFLSVCSGRALDGYLLLELARNIASGAESIPATITTEPTEIQVLELALAALLEWTSDVYGEVKVGDPRAWVPERLQYQLQVTVGHPSGGSDALQAIPDPDGEFHWSSFDVLASDPNATEPEPQQSSEMLVPQHLRFEGMPLPRYWAFESNAAPFPSATVDTTDLPSQLVIDMALVQGVDWYMFTLQQSVGAAATVEHVLVNDVFGARIIVKRADEGAGESGETRWTMYSHSRLDAAGNDVGLANYLVVPFAAGGTMMTGEVLEDVRFARDETANMAWAMERVISSPLGRARPGAERDAAVPLPSPPSSATPGSPLEYRIESNIPLHWTPLLGVYSGNDFGLEKAGVVRPLPSNGSPGIVLPKGRLLNPTSVPANSVYRIREEEVPRIGKTLQRGFYRARWMDGSTHLWVARRRNSGGGEAKSNLRFDQALPTER